MTAVMTVVIITDRGQEHGNDRGHGGMVVVLTVVMTTVTTTGPYSWR